MDQEQNDEDILAMLDDEFGADDDSDDDAVEHLDHNSESELSDFEDGDEHDPVPLNIVELPLPPDPTIFEPMEEDNAGEQQQDVREDNHRQMYHAGNTNELYVANDGTRWRMNPELRGRRRQRTCDLIRHVPGVKNVAKHADTPLKAFALFFPNEVLEEIVVCTNNYIQTIQGNYNRERDAAPTTLPELRACIGLLFLAGVKKMSHTDLVDLWKTDGTGVEYFRLTMGLNRFRFLLRSIRFDDLRSRAERKATDKLAAVRYLLDHFNNNCKKAYSLSEMVTIDEMLEAFRGRCGFRQYIPNKPAKYGLKIFALTDAKMFYTNNIEVYCGTQPEGPYKCENDAFSIVKRLVQPISNSGRNITCDNWFTSLPLVQDFLHNEKLTVVGTLRGNRKGIPDFMKNKKDHPVGSTIFAYKENLTLLSYKPKGNKIVLAISSFHNENDTVEEVPHLGIDKPEIVLFYNKTKSGVDKVDEMKAAYSVARKTRRWTLVMFFALLNIGGVNAFVVFKGNTGSTLARNEFLSTLVKQLLEEHLRMRVYQENLPKSIRYRLSEILEVPQRREERPRAAPAPGGARGRCGDCDRKKNRPSRFSCENCGKYICLEHVRCFVCHDCHARVAFNEVEDDSE